MVKPMLYTKISSILRNMSLFVQTKQIKYINSNQMQASIKALRELDYAIPKYDYDSDELHKPKRIALFLINHMAEYFLRQGKIIIFNDDGPDWKSSASHINTFILTLNEEDTHKILYPGVPTGTDHHDFNTEFIQQLTCYTNNNTTDTTKHAFDSFKKKRENGKIERGYYKPARKLDFKSKYWTGKSSEHQSDYLIFLSFDGTVTIKTAKTHIEKPCKFIPADDTAKYLEYYKTADEIFQNLQPYSWEDFILE